MATNIYGATALTGGGTGALDAINGASLNSGDAAVVFVLGDKVYQYCLSATVNASESSPTIIVPDTTPSTKGWVLTNTYLTSLNNCPVGQSTAASGTFTSLVSDTLTTATITATHATIPTIVSTTGSVVTVNTASVNTTNMVSSNVTISGGSISGVTLTNNLVTATTVDCATLLSTDASIEEANIASLTSNGFTSSNVTITGGTIGGVTYTTLNAGTLVANVASVETLNVTTFAPTVLNCATVISTNASLDNMVSPNVTITGGSITGLTNLDFLTATVCASVRDNLGLSTATARWYVSKDGNNSNSGKSWADALLTVQVAITAATATDTIEIGPGTYLEDLAINKSLTFIGPAAILGNVSGSITISGAGTIVYALLNGIVPVASLTCLNITATAGSVMLNLLGSFSSLVDGATLIHQNSADNAIYLQAHSIGIFANNCFITSATTTGYCRITVDEIYSYGTGNIGFGVAAGAEISILAPKLHDYGIGGFTIVSGSPGSAASFSALVSYLSSTTLSNINGNVTGVVTTSDSGGTLTQSGAGKLSLLQGNKINSVSVTTGTLVANTASVLTVNAATVDADNLVSANVTLTGGSISGISTFNVGTLVSNIASIETLNVTTFAPSTINTTTFVSNTASIQTANIATLFGTTASLVNMLSSNVTITGGTIGGVTYTTLNAGTLVSNVASVETLNVTTFAPSTLSTGTLVANPASIENLNTASITTTNFNSSNVTITGGTISGVTSANVSTFVSNTASIETLSVTTFAPSTINTTTFISNTASAQTANIATLYADTASLDSMLSSSVTITGGSITGLTNLDFSTATVVASVRENLNLLADEKRYVILQCVATNTQVATGNTQAVFGPLPSDLHGWQFQSPSAGCWIKGITNTTDVQINRRREGANSDMLATVITLGDEFYVSDGVASPSQVTASTGDFYSVDVDAVHATPPYGLWVQLGWKKV